jgi:hypothetical protein
MTSPAFGELFPAVLFLALAALLLATFRGLAFAVVLFRVAFLALVRRVFFLAAISARSLLDSVTSREGSLARISHQVASRGRRECRRFAALGPEGPGGVLGSTSRSPEGEGREDAVLSAAAVATW